MTFIEANKLVLAPNDAVTVRGYETIRDGKTVFVATEVTTAGSARHAAPFRHPRAGLGQDHR